MRSPLTDQEGGLKRFFNVFFNVMCIQKRGTASRTRYGKGTSRRPLSVTGTAGCPPFLHAHNIKKKTLKNLLKPPSWLASGSEGPQLVGSCQCHLGTLI